MVFDVGHLRYSRFVMRFNKVAAQLEVGARGLADAHVNAVIQAASVDTNVQVLNRIVAGSDMFDAEHNPEIVFDSTGWTPIDAHTGKLTGNLTIRGTTKPVTLDVTFNGAAPDPLTRQEVLGFSATGMFSRSAFGLAAWYPAVSDDVRVSIQAEFDKPE